jgi:hypothetical protein
MSDSATREGLRRGNRALAKPPSTSTAAIPSSATLTFCTNRDVAARADVIERYRAKYEADIRCDGPMAAATGALTERARKGERLVLICWCWPKPCHGNRIVAEINRRLT